MTPLKLQGKIFVAIALLITAAGVIFGRLPETTELWLLAIVILLLGVPHGALDASYARGVLGPRSVIGWLCFAALYLLIAALVVGFWRLSPAFFLAAFLAVSAAHFSADPIAGTGWIARAFYGGAIIALPNVLHGAVVRDIFSTLVGGEAATQQQAMLGWLAWPWLLGFAVVAVLRWRQDRASAAEMLALALLAVLSPPLVAFTVYFCAMHSPRHILRTGWRFKYPPTALMRIALLPMAGVLALLWLLWPLVAGITDSSARDSNLLALVFIGLSALTVPHILLVERVRFTANGSIE